MAGAAKASDIIKTRQTNIVLLLFIYLAIVFIGGALVAPWVYFGVKWAAGHWSIFQNLTSHPFHRFVHRCLLIFAVIGLWPFCRMAGLPLDGLGLRFSKEEWQRFRHGLFFGFVSLACVAGVALIFGARIFKLPANWEKVILASLFSAITVGTIEQVIFRGALFGSLKLACKWKTALTLSSVIYALVHFFSRPAEPPEVTWLSGFFTLKEMLRGFVDLHTLLPGFLNLFIAGGILALAYQITGTLSFSIGLHAGWIFWLQTYGAFTQRMPKTNDWLWGTTKLIDGWVALFVLLTLVIFVAPWLRRRMDNK